MHLKLLNPINKKNRILKKRSKKTMEQSSLLAYLSLIASVNEFATYIFWKKKHDNDKKKKKEKKKLKFLDFKLCAATSANEAGYAM